MIRIERPIPPELFVDTGAPDLDLPPNPTDKQIAAIITDLGEALLNARCALNEAGVALVQAKKLEPCAGRDTKAVSAAP